MEFVNYLNGSSVCNREFKKMTYFSVLDTRLQCLHEMNSKVVYFKIAKIPIR